MPVPWIDRDVLGQPARAWLLAVLLGLLGHLLHPLEATILTAETPLFTVWQVPVLLAFVLLGPGPGLLAGVLAIDFQQLAALAALHPGVAVGSTIYLLEALVASLLYRRLLSLPMAVTAFWATIGWGLDALIYRGWVGLETEYICILLVKQVLNGVLYASLVELLMTKRVRRWALGREADSFVGMDIERYAFRGAVVLAMVPLAIVGVLYARASYSSVLQGEEQVSSEMAFDIGTALQQALEARRVEGQELLHGLEGVTGQQEQQAALRRYVESHPSIYGAALVDVDGTILSSHPPRSIDGETLVGRNLSDRDYFQRARRERSLAFSELLPARFRLREGGATGIVLVEPDLDPRGEFLGAILATLDLARLEQEVLPRQLESRSVSIVDPVGTIIRSTLPERESGLDIQAFVRAREEGGGTLPLLDDLRVRRKFDYYPEGEVQQDRLALNLRLGIYQPVEPPGWGVLVELPAAHVHELFLPTGVRILVFFALLTVCTYMLVRRFARRLTHPVRSAALGVQQVSEDRVDGELLRAMRASDLQEMQQLAGALAELDRSLVRQREATAQRHEDLEAQLLEAQKLEAVALLAGGVAHDFNNLLTPILGYADLGAERVEPRYAVYFEKIRDAAGEASELTQQLLAFGRRQVLDLRPVNLVEEVRSAPAILRPLLRENIRLRVLVDVDRAPVLVDTGQFHRILFNLAINSQDAMPDGGDLTLRLDRIRNDDQENLLLVELIDTGCGIAEENLGQIFEPFFSTKGSEKGTGLGLPTVHGIVQQHGGRIEVSSRVGVGTRIRVLLPEVEWKEEPTPESGELVLGSTHRRALVAEDEEGVREVLAAFLTGAGYQPELVESAERAWELFRDDSGSWDVLVTDVVLPGMNGRELHERVLSLRPGMPTLFITGYGHDVLASHGLPEGVHLLAKPFTRKELLRRLETVMETAGGGGEAGA